MKKFFLIAMMVLAVFALASCATSNAQGSATPISSSADNWWDNPPADTAEFHYATGYAKGSTLQTSREWAKTNANNELAQWVKNSVEVITVTYTQDAGEVSQEGNNMQALQAFEQVAKQQASAILNGVQYKFQTMEDGGVFVLAALPIGAAAEEVKKIVNEQFTRNSAAEEAQNKMYDAVDRYFGGLN